MNDTDITTIAVDQFLGHPPARVWQALIDPVQLRQWFMPNTFKPAVGHTFTFTRPRVNPELRESETIQCQVVEIQPEKVLSYSWTDAAHPGEMDSRHMDPSSGRERNATLP
jgi:uncharacterized protein YndB with AHSA1/START domain